MKIIYSRIREIKAAGTIFHLPPPVCDFVFPCYIDRQQYGYTFLSTCSETMSGCHKIFDVKLIPGQFVVFLINPCGQILRFSGELFDQNRNQSYECIKIFDTYEDAVDFAQSLPLPPAAKTWCLCDHHLTCIKSGTGDEEREYKLKMTKIKIPEKTGFLQKVLRLLKWRK